MENMLLTKGIILQSGEVNKDKVNLVQDKRMNEILHEKWGKDM